MAYDEGLAERLRVILDKHLGESESGRPIEGDSKFLPLAAALCA